MRPRSAARPARRNVGPHRRCAAPRHRSRVARVPRARRPEAQADRARPYRGSAFPAARPRRRPGPPAPASGRRAATTWRPRGRAGRSGRAHAPHHPRRCGRSCSPAAWPCLNGTPRRRDSRYSRPRISMAPQLEPSSLALHRSGALAERVRKALALLGAPCQVCPRLCSVDRSNDERGLCRIGRRAMVASHFPHFGEEDCLRGWRGSGTIFFSGCNLRCVFCQNFDVSWKVQGEEVARERLAGMMLELQEHGCHNINWVTPEHVVPQILEALPLALSSGLKLPIVYNTSSYDSPDSLQLMEGVVDVYMPDIKLWTREHARRYLGKREYADVMRANVKEMHRQVGDVVLDERGLARRGLIVRHLVMPGLLDETEAILRFVADELGPDTYVNLMGQYYPAGRTDKYEEIDRRPRLDELERAFELADRLGLKRVDPRSRPQALAAA